MAMAEAEFRIPVATTPDGPVTSCPHSAEDEFHMHANHASHSFRRCATIVAVASIAMVASHAAVADIVTGTLKPASAKASLVNAKGEVVAELTPGAYQLQLPVGKYKARCEAPKAKEQDVLVLSEPVTFNLDCG